MGAEHEGPVFDFSRVSWGMAKRNVTAQSLIKRASETNDADLLARGFEQMQEYLAAVVVSVPRSWLIEDAPADINWRDPASFDLLLNVRMAELLRALNDAQTPAAQAKN